VGAYQATPRDKSSTGTPQIWGPDLSSRSKAGKSYVVFGKKDNTNAIELSDIAAGIGGFVTLETDQPLSSSADSPMITKPPIPEEISDNSTRAVSFLPNTTYDFPTLYFLIAYIAMA
jgi:hypothetical protein